MTDQAQSHVALVSDEAREFVTFHIGEQLFGVEVSLIHDVFAPQNLTPVPMAPKEVAGVLNLRGRIVTAIDARARLGLEPRQDDGEGMAIGIEKDGESYGLIVDSVSEVLRPDHDQFEPNPSNLDPRWQAVARGVYRLEKGLLIVVDVDQMLEFVETKAAAA
ncbi:MAG: chemotaxis protein CheW [Maricaulaceae bacterium]